MKNNTQIKNKQHSVRLVKDDKGLSTVEYIIILVLIAVAGISLWTTFGETVADKISNATTEVQGM